MKTKLLYLEDTYLDKSEGCLVEIISDENDNKGLILDQTVFYPQGGGQPYDRGWIRFVKDGVLQELEVEKVFLDKETSQVVHWVKSVDGMILPSVGSTLDLQIDIERRVLNSASHTVGHCIDLVAALGWVTGLDRAFKGDHTPDLAYVKFDQQVTDIDLVKTQIQSGIDKLRNMSLGIIQESYDVTEGAPEGKNYREVYFEGHKQLAVGCGGTHLVNTSELPEIVISGVKSKKGSTTVKYELK